ncbi:MULTISPECIES: LuxR C-terminal-related transcriptional regulator [unclassified Mesorhizobium]|nr:hypothetical protein EJ074_12300 [Mesorhizobium sp. M3A.F.Ca.ET.080.04.2.1]PBB85359.1 hypothetical protein CK216_18740 [Mesorhizobium sp. WSM3876]RWB67094.1 MAG: hypothetical protein EOQ49_26820 [Mesorhizobium sp.]TGS62847.1 hypothetical protein EN844_25680 [Mesorhizobium sp. M3A.F.Ca.ET.201.01.1.1]TGS84790.1 hypothetical protein EN818_23785 [Mesorhizobium sp. M3A.F.Ca.ET.175.01.1.1]TGT22980.1 hypothetical protein EN817_24635 [Mesorhizobium sp. M3A.F.Ca.ET.174.01.1.1]TGT53866.1 hypothetica
MADRLGICQETVKTHRKRAYGKVGTHSKSDLFLAVMRMIARR